LGLLFARDRTSSQLQGGASAAAAAGSDVERFVAAMERLGLPSFAASDHDRVRYSPVDHQLLPFSSSFSIYNRGRKISVGFSYDLRLKERV
jgi:hypothetical protein